MFEIDHGCPLPVAALGKIRIAIGKARYGLGMSEEASEYQPVHEALAYRRGERFIALCSCGWIGRERGARREATRDAREHEERAPMREARGLANPHST